MAKFTQTYPTDLKYTEWQAIEQYFATSRRGRPPKWGRWLIVNAILYVTRTGCQWRMLPDSFPPWQTVYGYFRRWTAAGVWEQLNAVLVRQVRHQVGRQPEPSAAVLDSQSVKTSEGGEARGVDVYKQTAGRKRHIVVDTLGLLLIVVVHRASVQDAPGGQIVLQRLFNRIKRSKYNRWCRLKRIWVDGAYASLITTARRLFGWQLAVVSRPARAKGFQVLPHRWVVERTFGWFGRYRRLARDYEHTVPSSEAMVYLDSIRRMLKFSAK